MESLTVWTLGHFDLSVPQIEFHFEIRQIIVSCDSTLVVIVKRYFDDIGVIRRNFFHLYEYFRKGHKKLL